MRTTARAIVVKDNALLVMHRNKFGHEYYSLIGGGVDMGETTEQTLYREIAEETTLQISDPRLVIIEEAGSMYGRQYIYLCNYVAGEPQLAPDSIEYQISAGQKNIFTPMWLPIVQLPDSNLLPKELKEMLIDKLQSGFPEIPIELTIAD